MRGNYYSRNERDPELVLRQVVREWVIIDDKKFISEVNRNRLMHFDKSALDAIYSSGYMTEMQVATVRMFLESSNIKSLNESNIKQLDKKIFLINESGKRFINEGLWDTLTNYASKAYDKLTTAAGKASDNVGEKIQNAFESGWSSLKEIWSSFKEEVTIVCKELMKGIKDAAVFLKKKAESFFTKSKNEINEMINRSMEKADEEEKKKLPTEGQQFKATAKHFKNDFFPFIGNKFKKVIEGDVKEGASDDSKAMAESLRIERNNMLSDKKLIREMIYLHRSNRNSINEEVDHDELHHHGHHIEDSLDDKLEGGIKGVAKKVLKWTIKLAGWVFEFRSAVTKFLIGLGVKYGLFKPLSQICSATGGPGVFEFAALTVIFAEVGELVATKYFDHHAQQFVINTMIAAVNPMLAAAIEASHQLTSAIQILLVGYALLNITNNIMILFEGNYIQQNAEKHHHEIEGKEKKKSEFEKAITGYKEKFPHRNVPSFEDLNPAEVKSFIERFGSSTKQAQNEWSRNRGRTKRNRR